MTIGFFHVAADTPESEMGYEFARKMVRSARKVMPFVPIVHFTDMTSPAVKGVDSVRRKPSEPMGLLRMRHCAGVDGDWLFVDTDIIFQQPVTNIFKSKFDIAVTLRDWTHLKAAGGFSERMPYNTGVVFSRCPHFWGEVYTHLRQLDPDLQEFMGEQFVICEAAQDEVRYTVKKLSGRIYNFPPSVPGAGPSSDELQKQAAILHYKGRDRKALMVTKCA